MTALTLYKFLQDNSIESSWVGNELITWIEFEDIKEFAELLAGYLDDGGMMVNFQSHCIAFDLVPICEYFGIDPEEIENKNDIH